MEITVTLIRAMMHDTGGTRCNAMLVVEYAMHYGTRMYALRLTKRKSTQVLLCSCNHCRKRCCFSLEVTFRHVVCNGKMCLQNTAHNNHSNIGTKSTFNLLLQFFFAVAVKFHCIIIKIVALRYCCAEVKNPWRSYTTS